MEDLLKRTERLKSEVQDAAGKLKIAELVSELGELQKTSSSPDFWNDSAKAQETMKQIARLDARTKPWVELGKTVDDAADLLRLGDESLRNDLEMQVDGAEKTFSGLKAQLKFSGPFDDHDAILSIHAGAGGTEN